MIRCVRRQDQKEAKGARDAPSLGASKTPCPRSASTTSCSEHYTTLTHVVAVGLKSCRSNLFASSVSGQRADELTSMWHQLFGWEGKLRQRRARECPPTSERGCVSFDRLMAWLMAGCSNAQTDRQKRQGISIMGRGVADIGVGHSVDRMVGRYQARGRARRPANQRLRLYRRRKEGSLPETA